MSTIAHGQYPQRRPNGLWRGSSAMVMGLTGTLSKGFLNGLNEVQTTGLDNFVKLLDSREDPFQRQRGLITGMPSPCISYNISYIPSHDSSPSLLPSSSYSRSLHSQQPHLSVSEIAYPHLGCCSGKLRNFSHGWTESTTQ